MFDFGASQLLLLTLILMRTSGIVLLAPIFGTNETPPTVRALLAFAVALLLWPVQAATAPPPQAASLVDLSLLVGAELLVGLLLGAGVMLLFAAFQLSGHVVGQLSGMALGDVFNPGFDDNTPLFSQFLYLVALAVYALIGGHRLLLGALLDTFAAVPPGAAAATLDAVGLLTTLLTQSFDLGIRAAAPATIALLLAVIVVGLVGRSVPQLNIMALGFGFNAVVTFLVLGVSLVGVGRLLQDHLEPTIALVSETIGASQAD